MRINFKKIRSAIFISAIYCFPAILHGQITFQKVYTTTIQQSAKDVLQTSDGGYITAGTTETTIINDLDVLISRTDNVGNLLWTKSYGGIRPDYPNCILEVGGGDFFVVGYSQSFGGGDQDMYLLKLNAVGDTLWSKLYGGYGNEDAKEIIATADGNYVIVGGTNSVSSSNNNMHLIKIDPFGNVIWKKYYGGPNYESARSVKLCPDGGFILAGKTAVNPTAIASIFMVKTNSNGDSLWSNTYSGGTSSYEGKTVIANNDGSYTLCIDDSSSTSDSDIRVMKIDASGAIIWNNYFGGNDKDICKMIQSTTDGGYIVSGISRSFGWSNPDFWLLRLNSLGDTLWTRRFGGTGHEHCYATKQTSDGGFITTGHTRSYSINPQIMLVKLDPSGNLLPVTVNEFASEKLNLNVFPNPSDGIIQIDLSDHTLSSPTFTICNSLGQIIFSETVTLQGNENKQIDLKAEKPGIYFLTVQSEQRISIRKIILN